MKVPYLGQPASTLSSRSPSLRHLGPTERSDCNGKGSPSVLVPAQASLEDNAEDENAEEDVTVVSLRTGLLCSHMTLSPKWRLEFLKLTVTIENQYTIVD